MKLSTDAESMAEQYISDCDNAAVLIGHQSLGDEITLHTHRLNDLKKFTFTIAVRITFDDKPLLYKFYDPLDDQDPDLEKYYSSSALLEAKLEHSVPKTFSSNARASILVFNGSYTPHRVNYNKDLYLFFVYDNVTFRPGMLDKVKAQSQITLFTEYSEDLHLYFFDITS
jgi:hypothetical protein